MIFADFSVNSQLIFMKLCSHYLFCGDIKCDFAGFLRSAQIYLSPLTYLYDYLIITRGNKSKLFHYRANLESLETQNILITFVQCRPNVEDVGPTLYKCYKNVLCMFAGIAASVESKIYSEVEIYS